jgi:hypothetical protein
MRHRIENLYNSQFNILFCLLIVIKRGTGAQLRCAPAGKSHIYIYIFPVRLMNLFPAAVVIDICLFVICIFTDLYLSE